MSLHCGEDTSSSKNLSNFSSVIFENTEGEHPCFSSTPLHDSSNHEDVEKNLISSDLSCHDLSTSSSDHDVDLIIVNIYKSLFYDNLFVDEVETPKTIEALQPELMVMSGPRYPGGGFTSDQEIFETRKVLHQSLLCIEDQPNTQISLPPLELDSLIAHAFEESYTTSTCAQRK